MASRRDRAALPHPVKSTQKPTDDQDPAKQSSSPVSSRRSPKKQSPGQTALLSTFRSNLATVALVNGSIQGEIPGILENSEGSSSNNRLGLIRNGVVLATGTPSADGTFRFALPLEILAGDFDLIDMVSGHSLLHTPLRVGLTDRLIAVKWSCREGVFVGTITVALAKDAVRTPLLIQSYLDGRLMFQTVAQAATDNTFAFSAPARLTVPLGKKANLLPRIAGLDVDFPLTISAVDLGVVGHLDPSEKPSASGWAIDPRDPSKRVVVEVRLNGTKAGQTKASLPRPDLKVLGFSDGRSGFGLPFPPDLDRRAPVKVQAFVAGTELELIDSPYELSALPPIMGCFDSVDAALAMGWVVNVHAPDKPVTVEAVCNGEVIGSSLANLYRGDVEKAGIPTAWCGFRFLLDRPLVTLFDQDIIVRVAGTHEILPNSPRQVSQNSLLVRFLTRSSLIKPKTLPRLTRALTYRTRSTPISIVMPVYNTKREWLFEALNSVLGQWSANWELVCIDDGSTLPHVAEILDRATRHDPRIRVIRSPGNLGIARATNLGLRAARGAYVAFMDHDDVLEPDCVAKLALAAQDTGADLLYSDEVVTTEDINNWLEVRARPAFSHDYYLSHPYFVHIVCIRTALAQQMGGWDETLSISADVDFVLRAIERASLIAHVPSVLYRWRTHGHSAGHTKMAQVTETMHGILNRHLDRMGLPGKVRDGVHYNTFFIDWPDDGGEVLIVIPTRNRVDLLKTCIDSIENTSKEVNYRIVVIDHESTDKKTLKYFAQIGTRHTIMPYSGIFNYALMNNLAVRTHGGNAKHILFLNNDVEAFEQGWLQRMRSLSARPSVGAVGALLLYGDRRIQHAGVLMAFNGTADHAMKYEDAYTASGNRRIGYNCSLSSVRDFSAVTAACIMIRADVFRKVKGFDEKFVVGFNDTDLCLRIRAAGYKVLYDGAAVLYHHESATRIESKSVDHPEDDARLRDRWASYFIEGDPFYNPLLAPRGIDHRLRQDTGCKGRVKPRVSKPNAKPAEQARLVPRPKTSKTTHDASAKNETRPTIIATLDPATDTVTADAAAASRPARRHARVVRKVTAQ